MGYLAILFFLLFFFLAWKNFRLAVGIFIIALPAYLIRFNIGPLPMTLLEVSFGALFLVWLAKFSRVDWPEIKKAIAARHWLFIFVGLFFVASLVGIFVSDMWYYSLGQWRAYFLEPLILFFMLVGRMKSVVIPAKAGILSSEKDSCFRRNDSVISNTDLIWFLILSSVSVSLLAIIQKLTGYLYPPSLWDDALGGRVTSFFTSPNAVGLYLGPVAVLTLAVIARRSEATTKQSHGSVALSGLFLKAKGLLRFVRNDIWIPAFAGMTALLAIFFSFSQGAWVALGAGLILFACLVGYKKTAMAAVLAGILFSLAIPQMRAAVLFQDQAGQNRWELWGMSWDYLKSSPKNFVFGAGIRQFFRKVQKPLYESREMERLIYPHNIFLNFWTETGLLGVISFAGIFFCLFLAARRLYKRPDKILGAGLLAALVVFVIHGLVDVPYFKNDLAVIFWIMASIIIADVSKRDNISIS